MDPFLAAALKRTVAWWIVNRPFSEQKREARKKRRETRKENRRRRKSGLDPLPVEEFVMETGFRTSTVAGTAGVVTLVLMKVLEFFLPDLAAAVPALGETVAALIAYVAARLNKSPEQPGVL